MSFWLRFRIVVWTGWWLWVLHVAPESGTVPFGLYVTIWALYMAVIEHVGEGLNRLFDRWWLRRWRRRLGDSEKGDSDG